MDATVETAVRFTPRPADGWLTSCSTTSRSSPLVHAAHRRAAAGVPDLSAGPRFVAVADRHHDRPARRLHRPGQFRIRLPRTRCSGWRSTNTIFYTVVATAGKFLLGLWLALLLNHHIPFKAFIRAIVLLPWIVPTVLSAIAWWWIYTPQFSIISYVLVDVLHLRSTYIDFLGNAVERARCAGRRQYLARHPVRRHHAAGRAADHFALALRGGAARRRQQLGRSSAASPCRC